MCSHLFSVCKSAISICNANCLPRGSLNFLNGTHSSCLWGVWSYAKGGFVPVVGVILLQGVPHFQGGRGVGVAIVEGEFAPVHVVIHVVEIVIIIFSVVVLLLFPFDLVVTLNCGVGVCNE